VSLPEVRSARTVNCGALLEALLLCLDSRRLFGYLPSCHRHLSKEDILGGDHGGLVCSDGRCGDAFGWLIVGAISAFSPLVIRSHCAIWPLCSSLVDWLENRHLSRTML
jgi:hypothetical protein